MPYRERDSGFYDDPAYQDPAPGYQEQPSGFQDDPAQYPAPAPGYQEQPVGYNDAPAPELPAADVGTYAAYQQQAAAPREQASGFNDDPGNQPGYVDEWGGNDPGQQAPPTAWTSGFQAPLAQQDQAPEQGYTPADTRGVDQWGPQDQAYAPLPDWSSGFTGEFGGNDPGQRSPLQGYDTTNYQGPGMEHYGDVQRHAATAYGDVADWDPNARDVNDPIIRRFLNGDLDDTEMLRYRHQINAWLKSGAPQEVLNHDYTRGADQWQRAQFEISSFQNAQRQAPNNAYNQAYDQALPAIQQGRQDDWAAQQAYQQAAYAPYAGSNPYDNPEQYGMQGTQPGRAGYPQEPPRQPQAPQPGPGGLRGVAQGIAGGFDFLTGQAQRIVAPRSPAIASGIGGVRRDIRNLAGIDPSITPQEFGALSGQEQFNTAMGPLSTAFGGAISVLDAASRGGGNVVRGMNPTLGAAANTLGGRAATDVGLDPHAGAGSVFLNGIYTRDAQSIADLILWSGANTQGSTYAALVGVGLKPDTDYTKNPLMAGHQLRAENPEQAFWADQAAQVILDFITGKVGEHFHELPPIEQKALLRQAQQAAAQQVGPPPRPKVGGGWHVDANDFAAPVVSSRPVGVANDAPIGGPHVEPGGNARPGSPGPGGGVPRDPIRDPGYGRQVGRYDEPVDLYGSAPQGVAPDYSARRSEPTPDPAYVADPGPMVSEPVAPRNRPLVPEIPGVQSGRDFAADYAAGNTKPRVQVPDRYFGDDAGELPPSEWDDFDPSATYAQDAPPASPQPRSATEPSQRVSAPVDAPQAIVPRERLNPRYAGSDFSAQAAAYEGRTGRQTRSTARLAADDAPRFAPAKTSRDIGAADPIPPGGPPRAVPTWSIDRGYDKDFAARGPAPLEPGKSGPPTPRDWDQRSRVRQPGASVASADVARAREVLRSPAEYLPAEVDRARKVLSDTDYRGTEHGPAEYDNGPAELRDPKVAWVPKESPDGIWHDPERLTDNTSFERDPERYVPDDHEGVADRQVRLLGTEGWRDDPVHVREAYDAAVKHHEEIAPRLGRIIDYYRGRAEAIGTWSGGKGRFANPKDGSFPMPLLEEAGGKFTGGQAGRVREIDKAIEKLKARQAHRGPNGPTPKARGAMARQARKLEGEKWGIIDALTGKHYDLDARQRVPTVGATGDPMQGLYDQRHVQIDRAKEALEAFNESAKDVNALHAALQDVGDVIEPHELEFDKGFSRGSQMPTLRDNMVKPGPDPALAAWKQAQREKYPSVGVSGRGSVDYAGKGMGLDGEQFIPKDDRPARLRGRNGRTEDVAGWPTAAPPTPQPDNLGRFTKQAIDDFTREFYPDQVGPISNSPRVLEDKGGVDRARNGTAPFPEPGEPSSHAGLSLADRGLPPDKPKGAVYDLTNVDMNPESTRFERFANDLPEKSPGHTEPAHPLAGAPSRVRLTQDGKGAAGKRVRLFETIKKGTTDQALNSLALVGGPGLTVNDDDSDEVKGLKYIALGLGVATLGGLAARKIRTSKAVKAAIEPLTPHGTTGLPNISPVQRKTLTLAGQRYGAVQGARGYLTPQIASIFEKAPARNRAAMIQADVESLIDGTLRTPAMTSKQTALGADVTGMFGNIGTKVKADLPRIWNESGGLPEVFTEKLMQSVNEHLGDHLGPGKGLAPDGTPIFLRSPVEWTMEKVKPRFAETLLQHNPGWAVEQAVDGTVHTVLQGTLEQIGKEQRAGAAGKVHAGLDDPKSGWTADPYLVDEASKGTGLSHDDRLIRTWLSDQITSFVGKNEVFHKSWQYAQQASSYLNTGMARELGTETAAARFGKWISPGNDVFAGEVAGRLGWAKGIDLRGNSLAERLDGVVHRQDFHDVVDDFEASGKISKVQADQARDIFDSHQADAHQYGLNEVRSHMRDYSMQTNLDRMVGQAVPFHYWITHNLAFTARLAAKHPKSMVALAAAAAYTLDQNKDLPNYAKMSLRLPVRALVDLNPNPATRRMMHAGLDAAFGKGQDPRVNLWSYFNPTIADIAKTVDNGDLAKLKLAWGHPDMPKQVTKVLNDFGYHAGPQYDVLGRGLQLAGNLPAWLDGLTKDPYQGIDFAGATGQALRGVAGSIPGVKEIPKAVNRAFTGRDYSGLESDGIKAMGGDDQAYFRQKALQQGIYAAGLRGPQIGDANQSDTRGKDPKPRNEPDLSTFKSRQKAYFDEYGAPDDPAATGQPGYWDRYNQFTGARGPDDNLSDDNPTVQKIRKQAIRDRFNEDLPKSGEPGYNAWYNQSYYGARDQAYGDAGLPAPGQSFPPRGPSGLGSGLSQGAVTTKGEEDAQLKALWANINGVEAPAAKRANDDGYWARPQAALGGLSPQQFGLKYMGDNGDDLGAEPGTPFLPKGLGGGLVGGADTSAKIDPATRAKLHQTHSELVDQAYSLTGSAQWDYLHSIYDPTDGTGRTVLDVINGDQTGSKYQPLDPHGSPDLRGTDNLTPRQHEALKADMDRLGPYPGPAGTPGSTPANRAAWGNERDRINAKYGLTGENTGQGGKIGEYVPPGQQRGLPSRSGTPGTGPTGPATAPSSVGPTSAPPTSRPVASPSSTPARAPSSGTSARAPLPPRAPTSTPSSSSTRATAPYAASPSSRPASSPTAKTTWTSGFAGATSAPTTRPGASSPPPGTVSASVSAKQTADAYNAWQAKYDAGKATSQEAYAIIAKHAASGGNPAPYVKRLKYSVYQDIKNYQGATRQAGDKQRGLWFAAVKALPDTLAGAKQLVALHQQVKGQPKGKVAA